MSFYLGAIVLMPTVVVEQTTAAMGGFLVTRADALTVSDFTAAEVASASSRLVRMDRRITSEAGDRLDRFRSLACEGGEHR